MVNHPNDIEKKTFLVAGAAGFVPSTLAQFYLDKGAKVIGIDNFITGSQQNIEILAKYKNFQFYQMNIYENLPDLSKVKIDYIYSLASPASPIDFAKIPLEIMRVNSEGTLKLLELAKDKGARLLEASTSEVYGDPEIHPQKEEYFGSVNTIGPRSCYDEAKRFAEALVMTFHRKYKVDTRLVRIFNTYGPRMRPNDGRVIPAFISAALHGENLTVHGDGSQTRSYCYITDLIDAIDAVMFSSDPTPFNCGNPDEYSVLETAKMIVEILKSESKIICTNQGLEDDPKKRKPDISKLKSISNFMPKVSFKEGIRKTAEYFLNRTN